jgi:hypothetical protein
MQTTAYSRFFLSQHQAMNSVQRGEPFEQTEVAQESLSVRIFTSIAGAIFS